jgi:rubrerythrin
MTTIEKAIKTAIEFETRIRDVYADALNQVNDDVGRRVFKVLAEEEQHHLDYLNNRLQEWQRTGKVTVEGMETAIPSRATIEERTGEVESQMSGAGEGIELDMLEKALRVERETSDFYRGLVGEMEADAKSMFARFLEIEEGHQAIVQAEIDALTHMGFWFDFPEFNLEANA